MEEKSELPKVKVLGNNGEEYHLNMGVYLAEKRNGFIKEDENGVEIWKAFEDNSTEEKLRYNLAIAFEDMVEVLKEYMDLDEDKLKLIAVWILGTYFHNEFPTFPFLFLNAMRGSGKTRLLNLISHLSNGSNGSVQTGITESVLFRSPPGETMVIDECESIGGKDKGVLREYLNACYKKGGSVKRMKKAKSKEGEETYVVDEFKPYKPIAMANIWGMEEVLGDRCISIILEKSNDPMRTKLIEDFDKNPEIDKIKRTFSQFSVVCVVSFLPGRYITAWNRYIKERYSNTKLHIYTNYTNYTNNTNNTKTEDEKRQEKEEKLGVINTEELFLKMDNMNITGRNFELLFPLVLTASYISNGLCDEILEIGSNLMSLKQQDEVAESKDVQLYEFVSKQDQEMKQIKELTNSFKNWLGESCDEWINEKWFGRALKRLNLIIDKRRMASGRFVLLDSDKAAKKFSMFSDIQSKEKEDATS